MLILPPDSFYDGGRYDAPTEAIKRALALEAAGADIIDLGGESSRPGARKVSAREELRRVLPVVEGLSGKLRIPISIDTWKSEVAAAGLRAGARMINDISAFRFDPRLAALAAEAAVPVILMHMRGEPATMQDRPVYGNLLGELKDFFRERIGRAVRAGVDPERIIIDPGIGFGKTLEHNLEILARLSELAELNRPVLVGPSRKSFLGKITGRPEEERLWGTAGAAAAAIFGGTHIIRVHDVEEIRDVAAVIDRIRAYNPHYS